MAKEEYEFEFFVKRLKEEEEEAQKQVAAAERKLQEEKDALDEIQTKLDSIRLEKDNRQKEYWAGMRAGELSAAELQSRKQYIESLEGSFREQRMKYLAQERAAARAEKALAKEKEQLQEITRKIDMHGELKDEWLEELRDEERKKEKRRVDEIGSMLFERKRREGR